MGRELTKRLTAMLVNGLEVSIVFNQHWHHPNSKLSHVATV
jgi:hypothetical protein